MIKVEASRGDPHRKYDQVVHRVLPSFSGVGRGSNCVTACIALRRDCHSIALEARLLAFPLYIGWCEGGALPVIMPIIGPRKTHDHRELNL